MNNYSTVPDALMEWLDESAQRIRARILRSYEPSCCVLSTKIGCDILNHLGVACAPMPCKCFILTPAGRAEYDAAEAEQRPVRPLPDGAPLGIGINGNGAVDYEFDRTDFTITHKWDGHMIIRGVCSPFLMDLSADQYDRPEHKIRVTQPVVLGLDDPTMAMMLDNPHSGVTFLDQFSGLSYSYGRMETPSTEWTTLSDWRKGRPGWRKIVTEMITHLEQELGPPPLHLLQQDPATPHRSS